jgi:hypothetical protein
MIGNPEHDAPPAKNPASEAFFFSARFTCLSALLRLAVQNGLEPARAKDLVRLAAKATGRRT